MKPNSNTIVYIAVIILFVICAFLILTYASGYKIDIINRNFTQTGIITVKADIGDIYLNEELVGNQKVTLRSLEPKRYNVKVKKEGFFTFEKNIDLMSGQAEIVDNITLFKDKPDISEFEINQNDFFAKIADTRMISDKNGELYQNGNLITRTEKDIFGASWYPDNAKVAFSYDNRFHIIYIDGTNDVELFEKDSKLPVVFLNSGRSVIYENKGKIYRADIR